jgi:WD40 repeat protein
MARDEFDARRPWGYCPARVFDPPLVDAGNALLRRARTKNVVSLDVYSSDKHKMAVVADAAGRMRLFDVNLGSQVQSTWDQEAKPCPIRFTHHPWACLYASSQGSRRVISYYSFHDHAVLHRFEGHGQFRVTNISMFPGSDTFASSDIMGEVALWDLRMKKATALVNTNHERELHAAGVGLPFAYVAADAKGDNFCVAVAGLGETRLLMFDRRKPSEFFKKLGLRLRSEPLDVSFAPQNDKLLVSLDQAHLVLSNDEWASVGLAEPPGSHAQLPRQCKLKIDRLGTIDSASGRSRDAEAEAQGGGGPAAAAQSNDSGFKYGKARFDASGGWVLTTHPQDKRRLAFYKIAHKESRKGGAAPPSEDSRKGSAMTLPSRTVQEAFQHPSAVDLVAWVPGSEVFISTSQSSVVLWRTSMSAAEPAEAEEREQWRGDDNLARSMLDD